MNLRKILYHPFWGKRLCPYPFNRLEIGAHDDFVPCCRDWIRYDLLPQNEGQDCWNGAQAQVLRRAMLKGDFIYCDQNKCHGLTLSKIQLVIFSLLSPFFKGHPYHGLSLGIIWSVLRSKTKMEKGPMHVTYTKEESCQLKCASCRREVLSDSRNKDERQALKDEFIQKTKEARTVLFSGGEVFYGRSSFELLRSFNKKSFPHLNYVTIMTNGLLFDQKMWEDLGESKEFIKRVMVSIDAGSEEHYQIIRGGNWKRLMSNLEFISGLRKKGALDFLSLQFVPRRSNYRSMLDFVGLGERLGVDRILFQTFCQWDNSSLDFLNEAVHLKNHPEYADFLAMADKVKNRKKVVWNVEE